LAGHTNMAQTGYTPISIYYSSTATNVPTAGNLVAGELAINTADGKLFYKDSSGVVQTIATKGAGTVAGSTGYVQYNNAGALGASSNFYWDITNSRLGLGTTSPTETLSIYRGAGNTGAIELAGNGNTLGTTSMFVGQGTDGVGYAYQRANLALIFGTNNTERMRIASNGYVGINTNVPSGIFDVANTGVTRLLLGYNGTSQNYYDADLQIFRNAAASENMRITSTGSLLIGTSSNTGKIAAALTGGHVFNVELNSSTLGSSNGALISNYYNSTTRLSAINFAADSVSAGSLIFGTATSSTLTEHMRITSAGEVMLGTNGYSTTNRLSLNYDGGSGQASIGPNSTGGSTYLIFGTSLSGTYAEKMRINSYGNIALYGATTSSSGVGITFPATQSASSDANCLDDYEEGTWTPVVITSGYTLATGSATYTKIGNVVTIGIRLNFSAVPAQNSSVQLSGLPFTVNSTIAGTGAIRENSNTGAIYMGNVAAGNTLFELNSMDGVANGSQRTIRQSEVYVGSITYFV